MPKLPVLYPDTWEREVYLPGRASWTSLWDGKVYQGGQTVGVSAPLEEIPVFLRDGRLQELIG